MKMLKENDILSEIAKDKRLNEDSRNPGKYFQLLQNMENIDAESWNATKNQAVRDAMVRPFVQEFWDKYKEEMDKSDIEALFDDMESSNFHTEYGVLRDIIRKDAYKMNEAAGDRNLNSNIGGDDMKLNESIIKNLKESEAYEDAKKARLEKIAAGLQNALSNYTNDRKAVSSSYDGERMRIEIRPIRFKPESFSRYENEVQIYGSMELDEDFNFVNVDINTSSGPNVINRDFITALNIIYTYISSKGDSYEG